MSSLPPHDVPAVFWIDGAGQQQGPEPLATVIERIAHDQIPPSTPVWWQGAANWAPLNSNPEAAEVLNARIAPAPAPAPAPEPAASPFSAPAPSESAAPFNSPTAFEAPAATFEAPATVFEPPATVFEAPAATFEAPTTAFEPPAEATSPFSAPAAATFEAPSFETPAVFVAPTTTVPEVVVPEPVSAPVGADAGTYSSNGSTDVFTTHAPPVTEETEPEAESTTGLSLGDTSELEATFSELTSRAERFAADQAAAEALDPSLVAVVRQGLTDLGFTIEDSLSSDEYHSFRLTASDGSNASLAIQRVPSAPTVEAATERPINCFVDHVGRASVGLFVGDYLGESTDQELFTKHLAAIVHAAGK